MSNEKNPVIIGGSAVENSRLTRRRMVQRLLASAGAGAAWPLVATSHPIYELLRNNDAIFTEAEQLGAANWKPIFLNLPQVGLLTAFAESIVPDSTRAQVSRFIDLLLSVDKSENQQKFVESLSELDAAALKTFGKNFPAIDEEQKNALLEDVSKKPEKPEALGKDDAQKQSALYGHFENLKGWVSGAFYSSEVGMRELGWTGEYVYEKFPGCPHPEGHH
ncbi:MAG TPA: gluconate 2-dehydrogenase subunit 3 family protein [Candidatus Acidoferrum sp.]